MAVAFFIALSMALFEREGDIRPMQDVQVVENKEDIKSLEAMESEREARFRKLEERVGKQSTIIATLQRQVVVLIEAQKAVHFKMSHEESPAAAPIVQESSAGEKEEEEQEQEQEEQQEGDVASGGSLSGEDSVYDVKKATLSPAERIRLLDKQMKSLEGKEVLIDDDCYCQKQQDQNEFFWPKGNTKYPSKCLLGWCVKRGELHILGATKLMLFSLDGEAVLKIGLARNNSATENVCQVNYDHLIRENQPPLYFQEKLSSDPALRNIVTHSKMFPVKVRMPNTEKHGRLCARIAPAFLTTRLYGGYFHPVLKHEWREAPLFKNIYDTLTTPKPAWKDWVNISLTRLLELDTMAARLSLVSHDLQFIVNKRGFQMFDTMIGQVARAGPGAKSGPKFTKCAPGFAEPHCAAHNVLRANILFWAVNLALSRDPKYPRRFSSAECANGCGQIVASVPVSRAPPHDISVAAWADIDARLATVFGEKARSEAAQAAGAGGGAGLLRSVCVDAKPDWAQARFGFRCLEVQQDLDYDGKKEAGLGRIDKLEDFQSLLGGDDFQEPCRTDIKRTYFEGRPGCIS